MPLVRIDVQDGWSDEELVGLSDAVHEAIVAAYGIPQSDRFHVLSRSATGRIIALDAGLRFARSDRVVVLQIFTQRGRSVQAKQTLYRGIADRLTALGVAGEDLVISYLENGPEDWSFRNGTAQYVTGELAVPGARRDV